MCWSSLIIDYCFPRERTVCTRLLHTTRPAVEAWVRRSVASRTFCACLSVCPTEFRSVVKTKCPSCVAKCAIHRCRIFRLSRERSVMCRGRFIEPGLFASRDRNRKREWSKTGSINILVGSSRPRVLLPGTEVASGERKPDELRLLKMTSGSTAASASTSSAKSCPSSTGTACTVVDGASSSSSSRVPRRVFSTRGRGGPGCGGGGAPAGGERGGGGGGGGPVSRAKLKTVKLTAAVVLSYFLCWSPFFISHLWSAWDNEAPYEGMMLPRWA